MQVIDSFYDRETGIHTPLSNFYYAPVRWWDMEFRTVEHAYQAAKCRNAHDLATVRDAATPGEAKKLGRRVQLRPDWEAIKIPVMRDLLRSKFFENDDMRRYLLDTGDAMLIEGNTWGDTVWGQVNGVGDNWLGGLLMLVRAELRATET